MFSFVNREYCCFYLASVRNMYSSRSNYHWWNFKESFNSCYLHCKRLGGAGKAAILWCNNAYHPKSAGQEVFAASCSNQYFGRLFLKVCYSFYTSGCFAFKYVNMPSTKFKIRTTEHYSSWLSMSSSWHWQSCLV